MNATDKMLEEMPEALTGFLDTLTGVELAQLEKAGSRLVAKVYQAGAVFALDTMIKIAEESRAE